MEIILKSQQNYILRLDRGEELIESLKKFCNKMKIKTAFFQGLGACQEAELAFYDLKNKKYISKKIKKPLEVLAVIGNVVQLGDKLIIHTHGTFGDKKMQTYGGHINYLIVAATCEIFLTKIKKKIKRKYSKEIGLNLLDF